MRGKHSSLGTSIVTPSMGLWGLSDGTASAQESDRGERGIHKEMKLSPGVYTPGDKQQACNSLPSQAVKTA